MASSPAPHDTIRANWRCFVACGLIVLSPFQYGLDFGLIGGLQAMPGFLEVYGYPTRKGNPATTPGATQSGWNISTTRQQLISSLMMLGAFISSATAGFVAAKLGRRACLWIAVVLCFIANIIMMTTSDIGPLYAGRFIIGLANGYFMTFSQLYIQESSPAKYRGLFVTAYSFSTSVGTLVGTIVDWATNNMAGKPAYLIPLGIIYLVPVIQTVAMFFIPESPRWLVQHGRIAEGRESLEWLRPDGYNVDAELEEIQTALVRERELGSSVGLRDMVANAVDRRRTVLSICSVLLQAASGSMFIIAYKTYFLQMAQVQNSFGMTCVLSTGALLALVANSLVVVRWGRRRIFLMSGFLCCGFLQLIIAIVYDKKPDAEVTGKVIVALSVLYLMAFNGLIASYAWLSGGEIPSQRLRSYTFGLAAAAGFFGAWLATFTAPFFINPQSLNWGPRYGYVWFPSCIVSALWVFFFLPEVKGRTLEEIDEMFEARLPARKFRKYKCVGISRMDQEHSKEEMAASWDEKAAVETGVAEVTANLKA